MSKVITGNYKITLDFSENEFKPTLQIESNGFDLEADIYESLCKAIMTGEDYISITGKESPDLNEMIEDFASSFKSKDFVENARKNAELEVSFMLKDFADELMKINFAEESFVNKYVGNDGLPAE